MTNNKIDKITYCKLLLYASVISILMYYLITDENETIIKILNSIKENNNTIDVILILSPIILIILCILELAKIVVKIEKNKAK